MAKGKKKENEKLKKQTNKYDALIRLIDRTYDILNSGNILGIIAIIILLVIWKLPPEELGKQVNSLMVILTRDWYYFFPLSISLMFSVSVNIYQRKIYRVEIKRLAEVRKLLIHGLTSKDMKTLEKHYPSDYDIDKT